MIAGIIAEIMIGVLISSLFWFWLANKDNRDWYNYCKNVNEEWAEYCKYLINENKNLNEEWADYCRNLTNELYEDKEVKK